jgi:spore coat protein U-like protein
MPIVRALRRTPTVLLICLTAILFSYAQPAHAQGCFAPSAFGLNFGTVNSSGGAATSQTPITCQPDHSGGQTFYYQVCLYLNPGNFSAGQPTRRMTNYNGSYLNYDLFADPAHTQFIGAPGTTPVLQIQITAPPATTQTGNFAVYGWVYPGQAVPATYPFQEQGVTGLVRFRYGTTGVPTSADCTTGGVGGGNFTLSSSGVLATFADSCWVAATDIDFGTVPVPQSTLSEQGTIRVQCAPGTAWQVGLDNGQNYDGSMRRMSGPGGFVRYQLYLDSANTQVWGNDSTSMAVGTTDAAGNTASLTVYGAVPAQPTLAVGSYVDTIIVTLYY